MADFNKSIELYQNYDEPFYYRAQLRYAAEDYKGCIEDCEKGLAIKKRYDTYYTRGIARYNLKDYTGALSDYNECLKLKGDYGLGVLERGVVNYKLENDNEAAADFDYAIKLNPKSGRAFYYRGLLKTIRKDPTACADLKTSSGLGYTWATDEMKKNGCK